MFDLWKTTSGRSGLREAADGGRGGSGGGRGAIGAARPHDSKADNLQIARVRLKSG